MNPSQRFQYKISVISGLITGFIAGLTFFAFSLYINNIPNLIVSILLIMIISIIFLYAGERVLSRDNDRY